jgi:hypothetical protein
MQQYEMKLPEDLPQIMRRWGSTGPSPEGRETGERKRGAWCGDGAGGVKNASDAIEMPWDLTMHFGFTASDL